MWGQEFLLLHVVRTGSGVHQTSYPVGTEGSFPEGKTAGAWSLIKRIYKVIFAQYFEDFGGHCNRLQPGRLRAIMSPALGCWYMRNSLFELSTSCSPRAWQFISPLPPTPAPGRCHRLFPDSDLLWFLFSLFPPKLLQSMGWHLGLISRHLRCKHWVGFLRLFTFISGYVGYKYP
jgi:hypothetical protein